jgi:hypothetical protein
LNTNKFTSIGESRLVLISRASRCISLELAIFLTCLLPLSGCNHRPAVAQVRGKVLYKDGSVPQGGVRSVRFEPEPDSTAQVRQGAGGSIGPDGSFEMCRRKPGDGVYLGKYAVTFTVWKAPRDRTSMIDEKYTNAATTPYHVTIDGDVDDLFFEIEPASGTRGRQSASVESRNERAN